MPAGISIPRRLALSLVPGLLLMSFGATGVVAQSTVPSEPSAPPVVSPNVDPTDGADPAIPDPTVTGEQPVAWDHIVVGPDGRTLTVYFWNGAEGCYGLKDVTAEVVDGVPTVIVYTGMLPEAISTLCIDIAQLYKTEVVLEAPILGGGTD